MADFPTNLWIRDPVISGRPYPGGALTRAMQLLGQCRDEITAIETKLGTDVAGTAATLAAFLDMRHAPSGLRRGKAHLLRQPNTSPGIYKTAKGWFEGFDTYIQVGRTGTLTAAQNTITFSTAYSVAPVYVIAQYMNASTAVMGDVQVLHDQTTTTTFKVYGKQFSGASWVDATANWRCQFIALGGSP
jgi:hypothetical protein